MQFKCHILGVSYKPEVPAKDPTLRFAFKTMELAGFRKRGH
jgi:hypothetical protein